MKITEHNLETNKIIVRDATSDEIADFEATKAQFEAEAKAKAQAELKRKALLDKLGITEQEAKLLLG